MENAKLKVEDDSGAFSSLASESPKPSPNHLLDISGSVDGDSLRVDSVQPVVVGNAGQNLCRKCLGSLEQVTPWALISEALTMVKGTMNIEVLLKLIYDFTSFHVGASASIYSTIL